MRLRSGPTARCTGWPRSSGGRVRLQAVRAPPGRRLDGLDILVHGPRDRGRLPDRDRGRARWLGRLCDGRQRRPTVRAGHGDHRVRCRDGRDRVGGASGSRGRRQRPVPHDVSRRVDDLCVGHLTGRSRRCIRGGSRDVRGLGRNRARRRPVAERTGFDPIGFCDRSDGDDGVRHRDRMAFDVDRRPHVGISSVTLRLRRRRPRLPASAPSCEPRFALRSTRPFRTRAPDEPAVARWLPLDVGRSPWIDVVGDPTYRACTSPTLSTARRVAARPCPLRRAARRRCRVTRPLMQIRRGVRTRARATSRARRWIRGDHPRSARATRSSSTASHAGSSVFNTDVIQVRGDEQPPATGHRFEVDLSGGPFVPGANRRGRRVLGDRDADRSWAFGGRRHHDPRRGRGPTCSASRRTP